MREIRSFVGLRPEDLHARLDGRRLVVWGGNSACADVLAALGGVYGVHAGDVLCMQQVGFRAFPGFSVHNPNAFLAKTPIDPERHVVIVASTSFRRQIIAQLEAAGAQPKADYLFARDLFRQKMMVRLRGGEAVDVDGIVGVLGRHETAWAGATMEIVGLPDPLACSGLEALLERLPQRLPLTLTSHLPHPRLARLAERFSLRLRLMVFSDAGLFCRHFPGVPAPAPQAFADLVAQTHREHPVELAKIGFPPDHPATFPDLPHLICASELSYPIDFSELLRLAELPEPARRDALQAACDFDLMAAMAKAKAQQDKPCMCERVFPVFRADASLAVCHLHLDGTLCEDPSRADGATLVEHRRSHEYCRRCQAHGLHRLDVGLLG